MDGSDWHVKLLGEACIEWMKFSQVDGIMEASKVNRVKGEPRYLGR